MSNPTSYSPDEMALIRQHEVLRIENASSVFETVDTELRQHGPVAARWQDAAFRADVATARKAFGEWLVVILTLVTSYLLNCVLIQEVTPDFAPRITHMFPALEPYSNLLATFMLTTIVFTFLLLIKGGCNTTSDIEALRPGIHIAVARPIRRRIAWKTGAKVGYLLLLACGYSILYRYIASGVELERQAALVATELAQSANVSLSGSSAAVDSLDAEIASSQAASYLVFATVEWLLHAAILFLGSSHWFNHGFDLALASKRRDLKRHAEIASRHSKAKARLKSLCQPCSPDDGANDVRSVALASAGMSGGSGPRDVAVNHRIVEPKANGSALTPSHASL